VSPNERQFETAVQKVARTKNGDPLDADLFWDLIVALDQDSEKRHRETLDLLDRHVKDDTRRAAEIAKELEQWREKQAAECSERHMNLVAEGIVRSRLPHRHGDPYESDFREATGSIPSNLEFNTREDDRAIARQLRETSLHVKIMWGVGIFVLSLLAGGLIDVMASLITHRWFGL
jgi:hypothetical protein